MAAPRSGSGGSLRLAGATWPELDTRSTDATEREPGPLVLLPTGATEQHGPHLPLGTDTLVATEVCLRAAAQLAADGVRLRVAPALAYGASGEHEDFPGTLSIGHAALRDVLVEVVRSASRWAGGIVLVNGHGGNAATVRDAVLHLRHEGHAVAWTSCASVGADAHAGRTETGLLLHLAPALVRTGRIEAGRTESVAELLPLLRESGVRAVSANGVLGDPSGSTAEEGAATLTAVVDRVVAELRALDVDDRGRLRATR